MVSFHALLIPAFFQIRITADKKSGVYHFELKQEHLHTRTIPSPNQIRDFANLIRRRYLEGWVGKGW